MLVRLLLLYLTLTGMLTGRRIRSASAAGTPQCWRRATSRVERPAAVEHVRRDRAADEADRLGETGPQAQAQQQLVDAEVHTGGQHAEQYESDSLVQQAATVPLGPRRCHHIFFRRPHS